MDSQKNIMLRDGRAVQTPMDAQPIKMRQVLKDKCLPDDFYTTTNRETFALHRGLWKPVRGQRMDAVIVLEGGELVCKKISAVRAGDLVVVGNRGVFVSEKPAENEGFAFMKGSASSERNNALAAERLAKMLKEARDAGKRIVFVLGPAVIHTNSSQYVAHLVREGFAQAILGGNAVAVHDTEQQFFGTSLGVELATGNLVEGGNTNHLRAINKVYKAGDLKGAVRKGALKSGIFYECVKKGVPFVLVMSPRDDGPLPDVITDGKKGQMATSEQLKGAEIVVVLSTMLHGIAVGNMIPAWVNFVCVDINPAVVTKLADRGSDQTIGIVSDVGLFLKEVASRI